MILLKKHNRLLLILAMSIFFIFTLITAHAETFSVSIRSMPLKGKERIVGFNLTVKSGTITALPSVPSGWNISIDNDPSMTTNYHGTLIVGAAALNQKYFTNFVIIDKDETLGLKFDVNMEIIVTEDFINERRIYLKSKDLIFIKNRKNEGQLLMLTN